VNENLTKAEFKALVDAYLGARAHEEWAKAQGLDEVFRRAVIASKEARKALEKAVFG